MLRLPSKALALLAGAVLVTGACSSSASTPGTGGGATTGPGTTAAPAASPTSNANDPSSIITQALSGSSSIKSVHFKLTLSGTIKASALQAAGNATLGGITSDLTLDGTAVEGDIDVANQAVHVSVNVPAMPAITELGGQPITADVILVGGKLYLKASLLGPKYMLTDLSSLSSLTGSLPVAVPTPGPSTMSAVTDELTQLRQALDSAGAKVTLVGVEQIGGLDADHINVSIPIDYLNNQIAAAASGAPEMKIDSASLDMWIYTSNYQLAKVELKGASSSLGSIDLTLTLTNYDQPVTIAAPSADQVQAGTP